jgi:hypothetical protein
MGRQKMDEIALYEVKDGKIVRSNSFIKKDKCVIRVLPLAEPF